MDFADARCSWWSPPCDHLTPADLAIGAYERAVEPKRLEPLAGGDFDAYVTDFERRRAARGLVRPALTAA